MALFSKFYRKTLKVVAEAVRDSKLVIPISPKLPLSEAAKGSSNGGEGWRPEEPAGGFKNPLGTEDTHL